MLRLRKKLKRFKQWIYAVLIAAIHRKEKWQGFKSIVAALFSKDNEADWKLWHRRMRACYRCPIFDRQRFTCGSPYANDPRLGCYCYMPLAAKLKGKKCWIQTMKKKSKLSQLAMKKHWGWDWLNGQK